MSTKLQPSKADNRFVNLGILLFLDSIIIALSGWTYWLMISKFVSLSEVDEATAIHSLVLLFTMLSQMGFEYPLLKKSFVARSRIRWTTLSIELIITFAIVPALFSFKMMYMELRYKGSMSYLLLYLFFLPSDL